MAEWENIPRLDPALQDEIYNVQLKHNALVEAVRGYSGGSIAGKTNEVMGTHQDNLDTVATREKTLLSAIGQPEPSPSMLLDFSSQTYFTGIRGLEQAVDPHKYLNVSRATPKWVMGPQGKLVEVPPDTLAYEYDTVTGEAKGVLIEESRTNLLLWNEELNNSIWTKSTLSSSYDSEIAPDGSTTADVFEPSVNGVFQDASVSPGTEYVFSVWVKLIDASTHYFGVYDRTNGNWIINAGSFTSDAVVGEWKRVSVSFTTPPGCVIVGCYTCRGSVDTGSQAIWGAQLEEGASPSSYIPTTDSPVTRAADNVSRVLGDEFNPSEGTLYAEFYPGLDDTNSQVIFGVSDGTGSNRTLMRHTYANDKRIQFISVRGGVVSAGQMVNILIDGLNKTALSYSQSGWALAVNGYTYTLSEVAGDVIATTAHLSNAPGSFQDNSTKKEVGYFPYAMTETELQELTANG